VKLKGPIFSLSRKCASQFVHKVCRKDGKNHIDGFTAVVIRTEGGFGNQFIRTLCALVFSLVMEIKIIYATRPFLWIGANNFTTVNGIQVIPVNHLSSIPFCSNQWVMLGWYLIESWCPDFSYIYLTALIREPLLKLLPFVTEDPNALFIYLRGGDIWNTKRLVNANYGQPPCKFYWDPMLQFNKVQMIGGTSNPCVDFLLDKGVETEPYNDIIAMSRMVHARHIVLARSSRSHAILALSPFPKHFWVFDQEMEWMHEPSWWCGYSPLQFGYGLNCRPSEQFRAALFPWRASPVQVQFIMNSSCAWEAVPCAPNAECIDTNKISVDALL
jgi:hypothetical protein